MPTFGSAARHSPRTVRDFVIQPEPEKASSLREVWFWRCVWWTFRFVAKAGTPRDEVVPHRRLTADELYTPQDRLYIKIIYLYAHLNKFYQRRDKLYTRFDEFNLSFIYLYARFYKFYRRRSHLYTGFRKLYTLRSRLYTRFRELYTPRRNLDAPRRPLDRRRRAFTPMKSAFDIARCDFKRRSAADACELFS
jgi:hypothetical protein